MKLKKTMLKMPSIDIAHVEREVNKFIKEKNITSDDIVYFNDQVYNDSHPNPDLAHSTQVQWTRITIWYKVNER